MQTRPCPAAEQLVNCTYQYFTIEKAQCLIDIYSFYTTDKKYHDKRGLLVGGTLCQYALPPILQLIMQLLADCIELLFKFNQAKFAEKLATYLINLLIAVEGVNEIKPSINKTFVTLAMHLSDQAYRRFTQAFILFKLELPNRAANSLWQAICSSFDALTRPLTAEDNAHRAIYENYLAKYYVASDKLSYGQNAAPNPITPLRFFYCHDADILDQIHHKIIERTKTKKLYPHPTGP